MRKKILFVLAVMTVTMLTGCGDEQAESGAVSDTTTIESEETTTEETTTVDETTEETTTDENVTDETEVKDTTQENVTTEESTTIQESTTSKEAETTTKQPETTTKQPETTTKEQHTTTTEAETTTKEAETTTEPVTAAPIVKTEGEVNKTYYDKVVGKFEPIVKDLRKEGVVKDSDVCVVIDKDNIWVDITFDSDDVDFKLIKNNTDNTYKLTIDYNHCWMPGIMPEFNGKDLAEYNKRILLAVLSLVSDEYQTVFERIDLDCFSAFGLSDTKWTEIGDCFIKAGGGVVEKFLVYDITKEAKDTRDKSFVITYTQPDGKVVECVMEYDSSKVVYETTGSGVSISDVNGDENGTYGYPVIKTGCASVEEYKKMLIERFKEMGDPAPTITEFTPHTVNGYTYYWIEAFYKTADSIGDPDILYVQIGDNMYLEIYNIWFVPRLEDVVNDTIYIKEVR